MYFNFHEYIFLCMQALFITVESPSMCNLWYFPCFPRIRPAKRACNSAMLLVPDGREEAVIATTTTCESRMHAPNLEGPRFPREAPSKFNFYKPPEGYVQWIVDWGTKEWFGYLIFQPLGMTNYFHCWMILESHVLIIGLNFEWCKLEFVTFDIESICSFPMK